MAKAAKDFGVEFFYMPVDFASKPQQEAQIREKLEEWRIDLVVLATYMQILSPEFVQDYSYSIINIHHSFLPAFAGAQPYR